MTEEEQADTMNVNAHLIVAAGVPEHHMEGELKLIKGILKRFERQKELKARIGSFVLGTLVPVLSLLCSITTGTIIHRLPFSPSDDSRVCD